MTETTPCKTCKDMDTSSILSSSEIAEVRVFFKIEFRKCVCTNNIWMYIFALETLSAPIMGSQWWWTSCAALFRKNFQVCHGLLESCWRSGRIFWTPSWFPLDVLPKCRGMPIVQSHIISNVLKFGSSHDAYRLCCTHTQSKASQHLTLTFWSSSTPFQ